MAQMKVKMKRDRHHVENLLLSKMRANRGANGLSEAVGIERLRILLDSSCSLFSIYLVHYLLVEG